MSYYNYDGYVFPNQTRRYQKPKTYRVKQPINVNKAIDNEMKIENELVMLKHDQNQIRKQIKKDKKALEKGANVLNQPITYKPAPMGMLAVGRRTRRNNARRLVANSEKMNNGFRFNGMTLDYLNLVNNPLNCVNLSRIPDSVVQPSINFLDYIPPITMKADAYTADLLTDGAADGLVLFFTYGYNQFWYDNKTILSNYDVYQVFYAVVNTNGKLCSCAEENFIGTVAFTNAGKIFYGQPAENVVPGLASSGRIVSMGMRALPTIEWNTNSDTIAVSKYYGGQCQLNAIYNNFWQTSDAYYSFESYVQGLNGVVSFNNNEGCCVRLNPFVNEKFRTYASNAQLAGQYNGAENTNFQLDFGDCMTPFIYIKLTQPIQPDTEPVDNVATFTFPIWFDVRMVLECQLQQPTPLYPTPSPCDPLWNTVISIMSTIPESEFPYVTKGHSFHSFMKGVGKALNYAHKFLKFGTDIIGPVQQIYSTASMFM